MFLALLIAFTYVMCLTAVVCNFSCVLFFRLYTCALDICSLNYYYYYYLIRAIEFWYTCLLYLGLTTFLIEYNFG